MKLKKISILSMVCLIAALTSGCLWTRVKVNDPDIVSRSLAVKENVTKESELSSILKAKPSMRMPGKETTLLGYSFSDTKNNGLMLIIFNFTRSTTVADTLYIETDSRTGVVKKIFRPEHRPIKWEFWPFD